MRDLASSEAPRSVEGRESDETLTVGLDYRPAVLHSAGIGRYVRGLVEGLDALPAEELRGLKVVLFALFFRRFAREVRRLASPRSERFKRRARPVPGKLIRWLGPRGRPILEALLGSVDVFHYTDYQLPPFRRPRLVATLHDAAFLRSDHWLPSGHRGQMIDWSRRAVEESSRIITVSESSRRDLVDRLDADPHRIRVIPLAAASGFFEPRTEEERKEVRKRLGIRKAYVLSLGTREPRKNLVRLVRAFARLKEQSRLPLQLVIAGAEGWLGEDLLKTLAELPRSVRDEILLPGYVAEADLPALYQGARIFAYPSLWEGFGLPILEGFASRVPVLTSSVSSLPEVAGGGALLVDPEDEEALAEGLRQLGEDEELRGRLVERGLARSREFSWTSTARRTLAVYREANLA